MGGVIQLFRSINGLIPHQYLIPLLVVLVIVALPGFLHSVKTKQLRSQVREVAKAMSVDTKKEEEDRALAMTEGKPRRLVALADAALGLQQRSLADRAIAELLSVDPHSPDIPRLRRELSPPPPTQLADPIEAIVTVRRLKEQGLLPMARARVEEGLQRFPEDPELLALQAELANSEQLS